MKYFKNWTFSKEFLIIFHIFNNFELHLEPLFFIHLHQCLAPWMQWKRNVTAWGKAAKQAGWMLERALKILPYHRGRYHQENRMEQQNVVSTITMKVVWMIVRAMRNIPQRSSANVRLFFNAIEICKSSLTLMLELNSV